MTTTQAINTFATGTTNAKKAQAQLNYYRHSSDFSLRHVYGNYSIYKEQAFNYCVELMNALNGDDLRIISHNAQTFTVGFYFSHPVTGVECFAYITKDYNRFCEV